MNGLKFRVNVGRYTFLMDPAIGLFLVLLSPLRVLGDDYFPTFLFGSWALFFRGFNC